MKFIPLGLNGYYPAQGRGTCAYLALYDDAAFLLDAGTGVGRMAAPPLLGRLASYPALDVLLSHYHLDHLVGLYYFYTAFPDRPRHVHAPGRPFIDCDPEEAIGRLFRPPLNSFSLADNLMTVVPVTETEQVLAGHRIRRWPQRHPGGSVGIRIDDDLAYCSDTVVMPENAAHCRGVKLLLHEIWLTDEDAAADEAERARHAALTPVAEFVRAAAPRRMMPIHLPPTWTNEQALRAAADLGRISGVPVTLPTEGEAYEV